jgi:hypothetical protein
MRYDRTERVMEEMELLTHGIASRSCLTVKLGTMNLGKAVSELIRCKGSTPRRAAAPHSLLSLGNLLLLCFAEELVLDLLSGGGRLALSDGGHGERAKRASWRGVNE